MRTPLRRPRRTHAGSSSSPTSSQNLIKLDATIGDEFLHNRADLQKALILLFRAKAHHIFDTGSVIPTAIENHNLTRSREVLHEALQIVLRLLAVRWCRQRDDAENARAHALCKGLDRTAFSRSIAALKDDNDAQPFMPHPFLQLADFDLKFAQFLFVFLALEFRFLWGRLGAFSMRSLYSKHVIDFS